MSKTLTLCKIHYL